MANTTNRNRRLLRGAVLAAAVAVLASGCSEKPSLEGHVTFKTIESPRMVENCAGVPPICNQDTVPTTYRVEVTYPDDPKLFAKGSYYVGHECWFDVQPDEYAAVELGDTVLLGNPANEWTGPKGCDLDQDLAPNSYVPEDEVVIPSNEGAESPADASRG